MDYSNIPTGLKIQSQIPLNSKEWVKDEATLAYLGVDDNLAFTYHDQLEVLCLAEKTLYIWREVQPGEENTGLIPLDFTYPSGLPLTFGVDYSSRKFNFFKVDYITLDNINEAINIINVGIGAGLYKSYNSLLNQHEFKTLTSTDNTVVITNSANEIDIKSSIAIEAGTNVSVSGNGTTTTPYIINSDTPLTQLSLVDGITTIVNGDGITVPYSTEITNLQKEITANYALQTTDNNHTIIINNGITPISITVNNTLPPNGIVYFIQQGTGDVNFNVSGVTINSPGSMTKIKGQNYWACLIKVGSSTVYQLLGSLKA